MPNGGLSLTNLGTEPLGVALVKPKRFTALVQQASVKAVEKPQQKSPVRIVAANTKPVGMATSTTTAPQEPEKDDKKWLWISLLAMAVAGAVFYVVKFVK